MFEKIESAENVNGERIDIYENSRGIVAAVDNETGEIVKEFYSYEKAVADLMRCGYRF